MNDDRRRFGRLLRQLRENNNKTMGDLADHLGTTVSFVSDMERGQKPPMTSVRIRQTSSFLGLNAGELEALLIAAACSRGNFELDAENVTPKAREVGAMLMRSWSELTDEQLEAIESAMKQGHDD